MSFKDDDLRGEEEEKLFVSEETIIEARAWPDIALFHLHRTIHFEVESTTSQHDGLDNGIQRHLPHVKQSWSATSQPRVQRRCSSPAYVRTFAATPPLILEKIPLA